MGRGRRSIPFSLKFLPNNGAAIECMENVNFLQSDTGIIHELPLTQPRVLVVLPAFIPSTQIYVVKPILALHRSGRIKAEIALEYGVSYDSVVKADVVVFCRNTEPAYNWILDTALDEKRPVVYELDDNFFEIPPTTAVGRYHRAPERLAQLERYLRGASLVRVYSQALGQRVVGLNPHVVPLEGPVDLSLIPPETTRHDQDKVRIVYATSRVEDELANLFLEDVSQILRRYEGRVEMFFWGYHPADFRGHPAVRFFPFIRNYNDYFYRFARCGFDIGLAPLLGDVFCQSKSNVKFREYSACGIAGIYSKVGSYRECIEHERTGLFVDNRGGGWFEALTRLIENVDLRQSIRSNAAAFARSHYDLNLFQDEWWRQVQTILAKSDHAIGRLPQRPSINIAEGEVLKRSQSAQLRRYGVKKRLLLAGPMGAIKKLVQAIAMNGFQRTGDMLRCCLGDLAHGLRLKVILHLWSLRNYGLGLAKNLARYI